MAPWLDTVRVTDERVKHWNKMHGTVTFGFTGPKEALARLYTHIFIRDVQTCDSFGTIQCRSNWKLEN